MDKKSNKLPNKYEVSYIYSDNVCRIGSLLFDAKNIESLIMKTQLPYMFTNKPNPITFTYNLGEYTSLEFNNKIKWIIESKEIPCSIEINFILISNTLDDSTLLIFELLLLQTDKIDASKYDRISTGCKTICKEMINEIDTLMQLNSDHIYEYKSSIILCPIKVVWDYVSDVLFQKMFPIENIKYSGPKDQVGTIISWTFVKDKTEGQCRVQLYEKGHNKKKWRYCIVPAGGPLQNQEVLFTCIKLTNDQTFLSISHKFKEIIDKETIKLLEENKIKILNHIKQDLEGKPNP